MKTLTSVFAALLFISPVVLTAADFEGRIKMNMSGMGMELASTTSIKPGGLMRMEMDMGGMSSVMIVDHNKKQTTMIIPSQQMYMVHAIPAQDAAANDAEADAKVERTNETAKIAGYNTRKYIATSKEGTTEVWMTEELGSFVSFNAGSGPGRQGPPNSWEKAFKGKNAFPLKIISKTPEGEFKMEATSVVKETVPASDFQVPSNYKKMDMGMGMGG